MLLRLNRCRKLNQCVTPFPNGKSKTGFVEGRWEIFSVADCREPLGAFGRHGGDDWFSRPVIARIFTKAGQWGNRVAVGAGDDPRYFQISVPVQPGNSGGALVDERGNVIGIVSAKLKAPNTQDEKFEDVVKSAKDAAVLVLVY